MNGESKINVHYSSLVDLKAELLRKQAEVQNVKSKQENVLPTPKIKSKSKNEKGKKNKLENEKEKNVPEDTETMKAHKKSKLMLEAKSRLYDKLSNTRVNMNPNFLVNFEEKPDNLYGSDEGENSKDKYQSDYESDDDGWVEYTDCFGRTKKCLKEDLPKMKEKDNKTREEIIKKPHHEVKDEVLYVEDRTPAREPTIEIMRRKWEEQSAKLIDKADIHYQDVLFDEARSHGVGYYAFSHDEEERAKQQESLTKLRSETEQKQKENKEINDMKLRMQQNRLKVARLRQRIRAGLPPEEDEEVKSEPASINKSIDIVSETEEKEKVEDENDESHKQQAAKRNLVEIENKIQAFGELLGKKNEWYVMTQDEWVDKKRNERKLEFGPTYNYKSTSPTLDNHNIIDPMPLFSTDNDEDIIGPMPPSEEMASLSACSKINDANVGDQIEAGLKYLRQQFENKQS